MTAVSRHCRKNGMSNVKRRSRARSDAALLDMMAEQAAAIHAIDLTRRKRGVTVERFAAAAGIGLRTYYRALAGCHLLHASTLSRLRQAQRRAAAGALA
jgi:hypothetical protein